MQQFINQGRLFIWVKGIKDENGNRKTKSKWEERYYGQIELTSSRIFAVSNPTALDHELQTRMCLKPAFNCDRSWIFRYYPEGYSEENKIEITYAVRFKKPEIAQQFKGLFEEYVQNVGKEPEPEAEQEQVQEQSEVVEQKEEEKVVEQERPQEESSNAVENVTAGVAAVAIGA